MAGARVRGTLLVGAMLLGLMLPATAMAKPKSWVVGDFKYVRATGTLPAAGPNETTAGEAKAGCGKGGWKLSGGGAQTTGIPGHNRLAGTGIGGAKAWYSEGAHLDEEKSKFFSYAICVRGIETETDGTVENVPMGPSSGSNDIDCPTPGTFGYGGGVRTIGGALDWGINGTLPVDLSDVGTVPDDGWRNYVLYVGAASQSFITDIVCGPEAPEYHATTGSSFSALQSDSVTAKCQGGHITGGGGVISGTILDGSLFSSYPIDRKDKDKAPDDAWKVGATNIEGNDKTITTTAICL